MNSQAVELNLYFHILVSLGTDHWILQIQRKQFSYPVRDHPVISCLDPVICRFLPPPLEKAMASHSSTLAWKIPWREEPGGLQSMGSLRVGLDSNFTFTFHFHALEKEMATLSSTLAWRIPETEEPGRLPSMGLHGVGHDWSDLAAAAAAPSLPPQGGI